MLWACADRLLGDDDLAIPVITAVPADMVRQFHRTATGARGTALGLDHIVRAATRMRAGTTGFPLRYSHLLQLLIRLGHPNRV